MKIITKWCVVCCCVLAITCCYAGSYGDVAAPPIQHTYTLTLRQAIALALHRNLDVRSGYIQRISDKYQLAEAYWDFTPKYTLEGQTSYTQATAAGAKSRSMQYSLTPEVSLKTVYGTRYTITANNPYNYNTSLPYSYNPGWSFKVVQPLLRGFGREVAEAPLNQAIITEKTTRLTLKNTLISTVTQVITDFHQVMLDQRSLAIQEIAVKNDLATIKEFKEEIKAGKKAPASLNDVQTTFYQDKIAEVNQRNSLEQDKQNLLIVLGLSPFTHVNVTDPLNYRGEKIPSVHHSLEVAMHNNVQLQTDLLSLAADRISLLTSEDDARWQLDLTGTAAFGGGSGPGINSGFRSLYNGKNQSQSVMLNLNIPIDRVDLKAAIVESRSALAQQQIAVLQEKWQIQTNVMNFLRQLHTDLENIKLAILRRKYAYQSYQVTRKEIAVGRSSTFELTSKSLNLTDSAQAVVSAKITYLDNFANFDQELGITLQRWNLHVVL